MKPNLPEPDNFGSLLSLNGRKWKKVPVLILDPEEARIAASEIQIIAAEDFANGSPLERTETSVRFSAMVSEAQEALFEDADDIGDADVFAELAASCEPVGGELDEGDPEQGEPEADEPAERVDPAWDGVDWAEAVQTHQAWPDDVWAEDAAATDEAVPPVQVIEPVETVEVFATEPAEPDAVHALQEDEPADAAVPPAPESPEAEYPAPEVTSGEWAWHTSPAAVAEEPEPGWPEPAGAEPWAEAPELVVAEPEPVAPTLDSRQPGHRLRAGLSESLQPQVTQADRVIILLGWLGRWSGRGVRWLRKGIAALRQMGR